MHRADYCLKHFKLVFFSCVVVDKQTFVTSYYFINALFVY